MRGLWFAIALLVAVMATGVCQAGEDALHISVVGDRSDVQYQQLTAWLRLNDRVQKQKYHEIMTDTVIYKERYAPNVKGLPTVRIQQPDGVVIYEKFGSQLPTTASGLHEDLNIAVLASQVFPWRQNGARPMRDKLKQCCPLRRQQQEAEPEPEETVEGEVGSVIVPPPLPEEPYPWWRVLVCALAALGGVLGGAVWQAVEMYQKK